MDKQEIFNNLNIPSFYQSHIPSLKVNGRPEALGLCPFHDDHNASLSVNIESGLYRCFSCDAKGDVFTFYQKLKGVDFSTALKEIREMTNMDKTNVGLLNFVWVNFHNSGKNAVNIFGFK